MTAEKNIELTLPQLLDYDFSNFNVLIIGWPSSGKTWLSNKICKGTHYSIHTDDFKNFGFEQSMYMALEAVNNVIGKSICEGVQGYRMLRKGAQLDSYHPDVVIEIEITRAEMEEIYLREREPGKIKRLRTFVATLQGFLNDYYDLVPEDKRPIWITYKNQY